MMEHFQGEGKKLPEAIALSCTALLHHGGDECHTPFSRATSGKSSTRRWLPEVRDKMKQWSVALASE